MNAVINLKKIKGKRVEKGLTQKQIAEKIGMACNTYNQKEQGKFMFTSEELAKIIKLLNIDANEIFFIN